MTEATTPDVDVVLNKSMPYSENRGEMQPDDPHYHVAFWQGEEIKVERKGKKVKIRVNLPFDSEGNLVPDDNRKEPWKGRDAENREIIYYPLWNDDMRVLLKKKQEEAADRGEDDEEEVDLNWAASRVNWVSWLTGAEKYEWAVLQEGAKKTFGRSYAGKKDIVADLVIERKVVSRDSVCADLAKHLPAKEAA